MATDNPAHTPQRDPYAAFRHADYRLLFAAKVLAITGEQMANIAIGWHLYEITGSKLALGLVGLVQVLPVISLALIAGSVIDRFDRRRIAQVTLGLLVLVSFALFMLTQAGSGSGTLGLIYAALLGVGILRTFNGPAVSTLVPLVVPESAYANAVTWSSNSWQLATIVGPAIGGLIIARTGSAAPVFLVEIALITLSVLLLSLIRSKQKPRPAERMTLTSLSAGFRFIMHNKLILGALTLDMFAVLFGGATALLPVYAKDILRVDASGLGWLQAAPSIGAMLMSLLLVMLPPMRHAGRSLLLAVVGFGFATIVFGLSTSFPLSMMMLFTLGALDMISVVVRHSMVMLYTPDEMRGRVSAVNSVFIGTSNQLGAFESGLAAALFGPVIAVVSGGIGTIFVVAWVARRWPVLRRLGRLEEQPA
jgi:MFS family permease